MPTFTGTDVDETITPEAVSPTVIASGAIAPSAAVDTIYAGGGNDIVAGGAGADFADLRAGDDRFLWHPGDGSDMIVGGEGS